MADPKSDPSSASLSRQILLSADREELIEKIELLQGELQRRMDAEEELLHLNLQRGTASLQSQVEEASRRFKAAQAELEAFRLEILQAEGDPAGAARPYIYEDLSRPPQEGPKRSELRGLLAAFRRLRDDRDRQKRESEAARNELAAEKAKGEKAASELATLAVAAADFEVTKSRLHQEIEAARAEIHEQRSEIDRRRTELDRPAASPPPAPASQDELARLKSEVADLEEQRDRLEQEKADARADAERARLELEGVRDAQDRASEEASSLRAAAAQLGDDVDRLKRDMEGLQAEAAAHTEEQAELGRKVVYEQARSEKLSAERLEVVNRLAETARRLEEARFELEQPQQSVGFERLEAFLQKVRLKALLEKSVRVAKRKDQPPAPEMIVEIVGATIGAQEKPLEAARHLLPRIHRPSRLPGLGQLRQFIESLKAKELEGVKQVHDALRSSFFVPPKKGELLTIDLDTLELIVDQQPREPQSYWPLVVFVPELQEFWHGELRATPENAPKAIADFIAEALARAPASMEKSRIQLRMDARFYSDAALRVLESKKCSYLVAPPDSAELRRAARSCAYADAGGGWEAGEWLEKRGPAVVRYVALRHPRSTRPEPSLPPLFRDPQHAYQVLAVDRKVSPRQALDVFAARGAAEEREHALLRDVAVNRLLSRGSEAHASFLPLFLLSADLLQWYRRSLK
jgi:chromosome segregation ATPase